MDKMIIQLSGKNYIAHLDSSGMEQMTFDEFVDRIIKPAICMATSEMEIKFKEGQLPKVSVEQDGH